MSRQQEAIETLLTHLKADETVLATFLKGSFGRGDNDAFSDVDFYCLVTPDALPDFLPKRRALLAQYRPILFWSEVNFGVPQAVVIYDDGLHLDFFTATKRTLPSSDAIKILHDPQKLLADYKPTPLTLDPAEVVDSFGRFAYTLVEIEGALQRGYTLWATHLINTLFEEIGYMYRYLNAPHSARLALKNIDRLLSDSARERIDNMLEQAPLQRTLLVIKLMRELAETLPDEMQNTLNWDFFDFMAESIQDLES